MENGRLDKGHPSGSAVAQSDFTGKLVSGAYHDVVTVSGSGRTSIYRILAVFVWAGEMLGSLRVEAEKRLRFMAACGR
jgi:hypothetical protein